MQPLDSFLHMRRTPYKHFDRQSRPYLRGPEIYDAGRLIGNCRNQYTYLPTNRGLLYHQDFKRLYTFNQIPAFVTRPKTNRQYKGSYSASRRRRNRASMRSNHHVDRVLHEQVLSRYSRRVKFRDTDTRKILEFLTNNFNLPALTITQLYRCRWLV